mmetsp:Transcript_11830/g.21612  ORF Transcript_11830/g.21612 Transcript_11830/m.21612 type:complete len:211 (-) Transcript_11830:949-1581(-)
MGSETLFPPSTFCHLHGSCRSNTQRKCRLDLFPLGGQLLQLLPPCCLLLLGVLQRLAEGGMQFLAFISVTTTHESRDLRHSVARELPPGERTGKRIQIVDLVREPLTQLLPRPFGGQRDGLVLGFFHLCNARSDEALRAQHTADGLKGVKGVFQIAGPRGGRSNDRGVGLRVGEAVFEDLCQVAAAERHMDAGLRFGCGGPLPNAILQYH